MSIDNRPDHLLGRGSHIAKISRVLEWLDNSPDVKGDELVLMMDAYGPCLLFHGSSDECSQGADIWFQLRKEVFISRYHAINAAANERLRKRLGRAADVEDLKQTIVFGAGKRCAPNQVHTVACYPIPESPLPEDLYGANTDTIMGRNKYTSLRQRYLNSGYIIGPKSDMRKMFARAWDKVQATTDHMDFDNGSGGSDFMYHGSDQSIFNDMLGEQEFQREVMRRRHLSLADKARGRGKAPKQTYIEGTLVDDPLNPSFHHQVMEHKDGKPDEFSMGLDYFSELGQQTVNAEDDARYITYSGDIEEQTSSNRHPFDCPSRVTGVLPADILNGSPMLDDKPAEWRDQPLYTNMCLNVIPAMMHHNGDKNAREYAWQGMWVQPHARNAVANMEGTPAAHIAGGADMSWGELCPADFDGEIFRDV